MYVDVLAMANTHDYVTGETGYRKLLVFVDALTRWVEAVPFNSDPTTEQVLDAFMTHVVTRHGCPMQVTPFEINDPFTPTEKGKVGRLNIIDLANQESCAFIATDDLGRSFSDGTFEVMGRLDASDIRGCNLLVY